MNCIANALLLCSVCFYTHAQIIADLPPLPSPSPHETPSPLPSALLELVHPSPSPLAPTAVPPHQSLAPHWSQPGGADAAASSLAPPPTAAAPPNVPAAAPPPTFPSDARPVPSHAASPSEQFINADGKCVRDVSKPRPKLGKSQLRYAMCVLLGAAGVAVASLLYSLAADWEAKQDHSWLRLFWIILARLLILATVKISAALVASITKASPDDSALDASGAFLTWGSAIFTRLYYEGFKMNLATLEFIDAESVWHDELRHFLSARSPFLPDGEHELLSAEKNPGADAHSCDPSRLTIRQRLFGGNFERKLLMVTSLLYIASELSVLTANVAALVDAFRPDLTRIVYFSSDESAGQCGMSAADVPIIFGVVALQILNALTQQPSLVPILSVSASCGQQKYENGSQFMPWMRWVAGMVLWMWVSSTLALPLFAWSLNPIFTGGDLTLFWYIIIAPPTYTSVSYIISATFAIFAALVGSFIMIRVARSQRVKQKQNANAVP